MSYRVVFIENEVNISVKLNNLVIQKQEGDIWIPIEDISMNCIGQSKDTSVGEDAESSGGV